MGKEHQIEFTCLVVHDNAQKQHARCVLVLIQTLLQRVGYVTSLDSTVAICGSSPKKLYKFP
jgi:hypothetical protein